MRSGERGLLLALPCLLAVYAAHAADKPGYGQVETFEPGKKYSCVPTADRKGWDCSQTGKAANAPPQSEAPTPPPAVHAAPPSAPPASVAATPSEPPPAAAPSPAPATRSGELPGYLNARSAGGAPPTQPATASNPPPQPAHAEPASPPAPRNEPVAETPPPAATPSPAPAPAPTPPPAAPSSTNTAASSAPAAAPAPAAVEPARAPPPRDSRPVASGDVRTLDGEAFLALDADHYVIELAHADDAAALDAHAAAPPRGEVYKLHLRQNGVDRWLLVWGSFDDVSAAREARAEYAAGAGTAPGWPRRVAPLQAEVRRTRE